MHGTFQNPQAFYLLWLLLPVWLVLWGGLRFRERDATRFFRGRMPSGDEITGGGNWVGWVKFAGVTIAVTGLTAALARPVWGYRMERQDRLATDVVICVDTSRSMLAADMPGGKSRLDFVKLKAGMLLDELEGERVALVAFAGEGVMACPFTYDASAPKDLLAAISADSVPLGGTSLASAIDRAEAMFARNQSTKKAMLVLTDGEDHAPSALAESLKKAAAEGVSIFILGVGATGGTPIKMTKPDGAWEYVKDDKGAVVQSKLDEELLLGLARDTGGAYARAVAGNDDIRTIVDGISALNPGHAGDVMMKVPIERYVWPTAAALVLLWIVLILPSSRTAKEARL
jgi:Ca-activated chloride channel family protein